MNVIFEPDHFQSIHPYYGAVFSPCRRYRYELHRGFGMERPRNRVLFVMLNPSTADGRADDATIRRCIGFAQAWGHDGLCVGNLYAWRSTDPRGLRDAEDPIGPENDERVMIMGGYCRPIVCAWGNNADPQRARALLERFEQMHWPVRHLRLTNRGMPEHPLRLPGNLTPQPWYWRKSDE